MRSNLHFGKYFTIWYNDAPIYSHSVLLVGQTLFQTYTFFTILNSSSLSESRNYLTSQGRFVNIIKKKQNSFIQYYSEYFINRIINFRTNCSSASIY